nr:MAG TPA: hypothetical protein [Caudoviricetes sp.]
MTLSSLSPNRYFLEPLSRAGETPAFPLLVKIFRGL